MGPNHGVNEILWKKHEKTNGKALAKRLDSGDDIGDDSLALSASFMFFFRGFWWTG